MNKPTPAAWLCELAEEDGTTRTQIVEQDPGGLRFNDEGEPSPFRVTPLYRGDEIKQLVREVCNDVFYSLVPLTQNVEAAMLNSTGDRGKYPNALDTLAAWAEE